MRIFAAAFAMYAFAISARFDMLVPAVAQSKLPALVAGHFQTEGSELSGSQ